jgi:hypothetical protein
MAFGAGTIWEVRSAGNAANSGGFDAGGASPGTDRSQSDTPHVIIDGVTITCTVHTTTTQLNIVGYTVSAADNRNTVRIGGGTMTNQTYEITGIDVPNNRWTVDKSGGTAGQTGTGRMGGANSDPALMFALAIGDNTIHIKAATYTITSATPNIAGGCLSNTNQLNVYGYQTTRFDYGTPPLIQASGISTFTLVNMTGGSSLAANLSVDGAGLTASRGIVIDGTIYRCHGANMTNRAFVGTSGAGLALRCTATGCSGTSVVLDCFADSCTVYNCTTTAYQFTLSGNGASDSIADSNSGATSDGFLVSAKDTRLTNVVSYNNGRDGVRVNAAACLVKNAIGFGNAGTQINVVAADATGTVILNNATVSGGIVISVTEGVVEQGSVVLTVDPFTDAPNQDFSLNEDSGGGAACRAAGYPGVLPIGGTGFLDIGALQSQGSGSGGAVQLVNGGLVS